MPTRNFASNKSSLFADGSSNLGGGADEHMPVGGPWNGYTFRSAVRFALDYSGMKSISSAVLKMRTSSQVHVGFSSDPDIYIERCSADWSANSSSSSAEGGSGWSTSPTVYPGPATTTANRVSKDITTAESTWVDIDITGIVRDWAPGAVAGGGGAPNYGIRLSMVASGDITEFASYRSGSSDPYIVVTYAVDTAPAVTMTGPTGVQSTTRPTLTGTATDPEGDAITNVRVSVSQGATEVYAFDIGPVAAGAWSHACVADLPGGALTAACYAAAGGLTSPWSNSVSFTVDRPPAVASWSAPVGAVSGNRRPVHTFTATDPDPDGVELYDIEVYQSVGGAPSGAAVWVASSQTAGISGMTVNHTPGVDLPGGPLLARSRVRTGPADLWSPWSAYQSYSIALTTPTVAWVEPTAPNAFAVYDQGQFVDQYSSPLIHAIWGRVSDAPPSGQTLTREARGYGYETSGAAWAYDGPPQAPNTPTGGIAQQPIYGGNGGVYPYGRGHFRFIIGASGGGLVDVQRNWRASQLEWYGAVYLGDNVTALSAVLAGAGGQIRGWVRAQASRTDGSKPWREPTDVAGILSELPATGAYIGLRSRFALNGPDTDLLAGIGSFEDPALTGWSYFGQVWSSAAGELNVPPADGSRVLRITGDNSTGYPQAQCRIPVIPGASYMLRGSLVSAGGVKAEVDVRADAFKGNTEVQGFAMRLYRDALGETAWYTSASGPWVCPADGSVDNLLVLIYIAANPSIAGQDVRIDALTLTGPKVGDGLDKWTVDWSSAG